MIFETPPPDFNPKFSAVGIYVMYEGKFILLKYISKYEGKWTNPSGKIQPGEEPIDAAIRETCEETGISVDKGDMYYLFKMYVRYPHFDFDWYAFRVELKKRPLIVLCEEHDAYAWVSPQEALTYPLIQDEEIATAKAFNLKNCAQK